MPWVSHAENVRLEGSTVVYEKTYRTQTPFLPVFDMIGSHFMIDTAGDGSELEGWEINLQASVDGITWFEVERTVVQAQGTNPDDAVTGVFTYDLKDLKEDTTAVQAPYFKVRINTLNDATLDDYTLGGVTIPEYVEGDIAISWWIEDETKERIEQI